MLLEIPREHADALLERNEELNSDTIRQQVMGARERQQRRYA